ncbi:hypothetical protein D3C80_1593700 [compost metagenome]
MYQAWINRHQLGFMSQLKHVVLFGIDLIVPNFFGSFDKLIHHLLLIGRALTDDDARFIAFQTWNGKLQHFSGLNISNETKHAHQFRQIMKLGKT